MIGSLNIITCNEPTQRVNQYEGLLDMISNLERQIELFFLVAEKVQ
jgi:hypothetical protein